MDKNQVTEQLRRAVQEYAQLVRKAAEAGEPAPPALPTGSNLTRTDVLVTVEALMSALDLDIFEIQIWRSMRRHLSSDE